VILRDKDLANGWSGTPDGVLEDRVYYCQNWRADVSAVINPYGEVIETAKFASYGTPICLPAGDVDADGDNSGDYNQINTWIGLSQYHPQGDVNMDGVLDSTDATMAQATDGTAAGRGVMSTAAVASRKGYAGYENDGVVTRFSHVRHRVLDSTLGRWTKRDPAGYVDGANALAYTQDRPLPSVDPSGLTACETFFSCYMLSWSSCLTQIRVVGGGMPRVPEDRCRERFRCLDCCDDKTRRRIECCERAWECTGMTELDLNEKLACIDDARTSALNCERACRDRFPCQPLGPEPLFKKHQLWEEPIAPMASSLGGFRSCDRVSCP
jgi:RHS repeat-associated protein